MRLVNAHTHGWRSATMCPTVPVAWGPVRTLGRAIVESLVGAFFIDLIAKGSRELWRGV